MLARRAERLLRWYPSEWRARYGDEFAELLISDMSEQPRSLKRPVDVAVSGVVARLAYAGLNPSNLEHSERTRRTLLAFACAAAVFVTFGLGMWAQLTDRLAMVRARHRCDLRCHGRDVLLGPRAALLSALSRSFPSRGSPQGAPFAETESFGPLLSWWLAPGSSSSEAAISQTVGREPVVTLGRIRVSSQAEWLPSRGQQRSSSRRTGRTRRACSHSLPPSLRGWWSARSPWFALASGLSGWYGRSSSRPRCCVSKHASPSSAAWPWSCF